jgi:hypothetical protein
MLSIGILTNHVFFSSQKCPFDDLCPVVERYEYECKYLHSSFEVTMSSTMNAAIAPANIVNDQPSMKAKEVVIKNNSETKEYELAKQKITSKVKIFH